MKEVEPLIMTAVSLIRGVGTHMPELLDGLDLNGATVSGFQASIEHITAQVIDGVLVLFISSYLI